MYHTQERRSVRLSKPILCTKDNAWLGTGYYFWYDINDAIFWGTKFKKATGYYDVYESKISFDNVLDTVFNEGHYLYWLKQIEKASKKFIEKTGIKPTRKMINDYFLEKNISNQFDGILFQDISNKPDHYYVSEFQYKKRIQLVVFNCNIIYTFAHNYEGPCV